MKKLRYFTLILLLVPFSCSKDEYTDISGEWDILFAVTRDIDTLETYKGQMTIQDDKNQITGNIVLDDENYFVFAELLPGGFISRTSKIIFDSYVWLSNDSISTFTLSYSGNINQTCDYIEGVFSSGEKKIGNWSAERN